LMITVAGLLNLAIPSSQVGFYLLLGLRCFQGLAYGGTLNSVPIYITELSSDALRGAIFQIVALGAPLGVMLSVAVVAIVGDEHWRLCLALAPIFPAMIFFILSLMLPESPRSLCVRGEVEDTQEALDLVFASSPVYGEAHVGKAPTVILEGAADVDQSYADVSRGLFSPSMIRVTLIAISLTAIASGLANTEIAWGPRILKKIAGGEKPSLAVFSCQAAGAFIFLVISACVTDRVGRRPFLWVSYGGVAIIFGLLTVVTSLWLASGLWILRASLQAWMHGNLFIWKAEVFPTSVRSRAIALSDALGIILQIVLPAVVGALFGTVSIRVIMLAFCIVYVFGFWVTLQIPKETANTATSDTMSSQV